MPSAGLSTTCKLGLRGASQKMIRFGLTAVAHDESGGDLLLDHIAKVRRGQFLHPLRKYAPHFLHVAVAVVDGCDTSVRVPEHSLDKFLAFDSELLRNSGRDRSS